MKIIAAPQALKGSLDAPEVGAAIARGVRAVLPNSEVLILPVADGGEGTVSALVAATGGRLLTARVTGPLGEPVEATFGLLGADLAPAYAEPNVPAGEGRRTSDVAAADSDGGYVQEHHRPFDANVPAHDALPEIEPATAAGITAVIEMAAASGLPLVPPSQRDPRVTTTRGTGELIRVALDAGARRILIGIGGSATNDGGAGMAQALGVRLVDTEGRELPSGGAALTQLAHIDISGLDPRLAVTEVTVASDVTNPLCGPRGASAVYGPQKGATPEMVVDLDAALAHYAEILRRDLGADVAEVPGSGAAGGLGAGLMAFLHSRLQAGAQMVLDAVGFAHQLEGAALVFTAEGRLDEQTAYGKAPGAVAALASERGIPVIVLAGGLAPGYEVLYTRGVSAVMLLPDGPLSLEESMARGAELVASATERALRLVMIGRGWGNDINR